MTELSNSFATSGGQSIEEFLRAKPQRRIILLRHGQTEWNAQQRLQGQKDSTLNGQGLREARAISKLLHKVPVAQVITSDLERCARTARMVAEANVDSPAVRPARMLREMSLGLLEGELKSAQSSDEATASYEQLCKDEINYRVPRGGECLRDVYARVENFFERASEPLSAPGTHVIVGHRNVNKMIIKHWLGLTFERGFQVEQENRRMYFFFPASEELWSCLVGDGLPTFERGYVTGTELYA